MPTREAAIVIRRPLRAVFPFVADAENTSRFRGDVLSAQRTSGSPTAAGATYRQIVKLDWRRVELVLENIEHEPDRKLSFVLHKPDGAMVRTTYGFETIETEHTRIAVTAERHGRRSGLLGRRLEKRELDAVRDLKRTLEARPASV